MQNEHALNLPYFCYMESKRKGNQAGVTRTGCPDCCFPKHHPRLKPDKDLPLFRGVPNQTLPDRGAKINMVEFVSHQLAASLIPALWSC